MTQYRRSLNHTQWAWDIVRIFAGRKKDFVGHEFRARGYSVSTVGRDEGVIRAYIWDREMEDQRQDQLVLT